MDMREDMQAIHLNRAAARTASRRAEVQYVYFIQAEGGGPVKIGRTVDVGRRLREIQATSPSVLVLRRKVAVHESKASTLERNLHLHFADARMRGEWFRPIPELAKLAHAIGEAS